MVSAVVVLAPNNPPDSAKPLAAFFVGPTQGQAAAELAAAEYKAAHAPTSSIQNASFSSYETGVVIQPA